MHQCEFLIGIKRTPGFAEEKVKELLRDLNNDKATHSVKQRAITNFTEYINKYHPEVKIAQNYLYT
jgi:hypothetical protein